MPTSRSDITLRPAKAADETFLWECLAYAAYEASAEAAQQVPYLRKWLDGWPRAGDFGVIALETDRPVGGAWARQFTGLTPGLAIFIDDQTPEIAIGVRPDRRGRGVGERLLDGLVAEARLRLLKGLCLTVRSENPAARLYERKGFAYLPETERINRVGGVSHGMAMRF